jgi:murein DD-endopeptidase MepM/ murein hydrolase activator NlpD
MEIVLAARSFTDLLDQLDYLSEIGRQDRAIAERVGRAKREVREIRARTQKTRASVVEATRAIAVRTARQRAERDRLVSSQQALASARSDKRDTLAKVRSTKEEFLHEIRGLERASAALAARIRSAQGAQVYPSTGYDTSASAAGLIWPIGGPVTSGFGWRWGRMHEGIDIGASSGAPIQAAASGVVIYAAWMDGYGNLVVIDHGGGLATAYAHMSAFATSAGVQVVQGQTIGYIGCTGHCFGSHLHFEVRVNGAAVDPLGYL